MANYYKTRICIFIGISFLIFSIWFSDGYMQWVNSDTAGEAFGVSQNVAFPQGLVSNQHPYHSRISGAILSYIPFNTVGIIYREITNDPVNAIYVSQGVMTGTIFLLFVLISSAYISICAPIFSIRYLFSAILLLFFTMSIPLLPPDDPVPLAFRFRHQAVMTNYIGTMVFALFALFPFWRYLFTGNWDDWYNDMKYRSVFYIFIFATLFSSTATMTWFVTYAIITLFFCIYYTVRIQKINLINIEALNKYIFKNTMIQPLILIIILFFVGIISESFTERGASALAETNLAEYIIIYMLFLVKSGTMWYFGAVCALFVSLIIYIRYKKVTLQSNLLILAKIFPWLLIGNIIFLFLIGLPRVPHRFNGYNLGRDTAFPATYSMAIWVITVFVCFWRERKLTWIVPLLLYTLTTNSFTFFDFNDKEVKATQKIIFSRLYQENAKLSMENLLPITVTYVAFSIEELRDNTIPMLKKMGIISERRGILITPNEDYDSWHEEKGIPRLYMKKK